jgi:hypothetical protein
MEIKPPDHNLEDLEIIKLEYETTMIQKRCVPS